MHIIPFANGRTRYEAHVKYDSFGCLTVSAHHKGEDHPLLYFSGYPKTSWQRLVECDEFVPLGVLRRALKIFDAEMVKARGAVAA